MSCYFLNIRSYFQTVCGGYVGLQGGHIINLFCVLQLNLPPGRANVATGRLQAWVPLGSHTDCSTAPNIWVYIVLVFFLCPRPTDTVGHQYRLQYIAHTLQHIIYEYNYLGAAGVVLPLCCPCVAHVLPLCHSHFGIKMGSLWAAY